VAPRAEEVAHMEAAEVAEAAAEAAAKGYGLPHPASHGLGSAAGAQLLRSQGFVGGASAPRRPGTASEVSWRCGGASDESVRRAVDERIRQRQAMVGGGAGAGAGAGAGGAGGGAAPVPPPQPGGGRGGGPGGSGGGGESASSWTSWAASQAQGWSQWWAS
jgi:hypothetical protein